MIWTELKIPRWVAAGIKPNDKGGRLDRLIYGADTETVKGKPLSLQFYSEDGKGCADLIWVNEENALREFLKWCGKRERNCEHVVYIHFLAFDLIELFWSRYEYLVARGGEFEFKYGSWFIKGVYGTPTFCRVSDGHGRTVTLVDSYSFYRGSLASAAALFCPDLPKLSRPIGLGDKRYTSRNDTFVAYAMRDAEVSYHIGVSINALHREFDLKQCVSVADMAARIFRHRFLTYTIPQPNTDVITAALLSYHGGKNNVSDKDLLPGWFEDVTSIDIKSAYSRTMHDLPAFSNAKLYKRYRGKQSLSRVPEYGVYRVTGDVSPCKWPCLFTHSFKPITGGRIENVWVQGFELNEALASGELRLSKNLIGYYYDHDKDNQAPALRAFVEDFFARKDKEPDKVKKYGYKTISNSVYGKFIQTRKKVMRAYHDLDSNETGTASELVAGGMFHPFIATSITAPVRATIHRTEHAFQAIHTATDGIFTQNFEAGSRKLKKEIHKGLGGLSIEARGTLLLVRNKCYVLYSKKSKDTTPSRIFPGKHIAKHALHGFQGKVWDLERLVASGRRSYRATRPNRLRESVKRGLTPNEFVEREYTLKVGPLKVRSK